MRSFNGPVLFTTNCIVPPADDYIDRVYTTGASGFPGCRHVEAGEDGAKDFSEIIAHALRCDSPTEIESGEIAGGFAHKQVLQLGDIGGIPRMLDAGQCNDSYSLAVIVLLALLSLGVKNIHLGPTLPAFLSPNAASVLVDSFGIAGIGTVDEDMKLLNGEEFELDPK